MTSVFSSSYGSIDRSYPLSEVGLAFAETIKIKFYDQRVLQSAGPFWQLKIRKIGFRSGFNWLWKRWPFRVNLWGFIILYKRFFWKYTVSLWNKTPEADNFGQDRVLFRHYLPSGRVFDAEISLRRGAVTKVRALFSSKNSIVGLFSSKERL